jgi:hypothetical protein
MSASAQEEFLAEVARHSLGAPFLFEPDAFRKGKATREPADLAWLCRDTLFLINMQESAAAHEEQVRHNLRQLYGWLRMWSLGDRLTGRNDWQSFDVGVDDIGCTVLVSVVAGSDSRAELHPAPTTSPRNVAESRVAAAVTIPAEVLLELARRGGSALDLTDLILRVGRSQDEVSESTALRLLAEHHENALARARVAPEVRRDRDESLDTDVLRLITGGLRPLLTDGVESRSATIVNDMALFNDLDWEMTATLAMRAADAVRAVRDVPVGSVGATQVLGLVELPPYRFVLGATDIGHAGSFGAMLGKTLEDLKTADPEHPPVALTYQIVGRPKVQFMSAMVTAWAQRQPSLTHTTLRNLRT